ncbi:hypothetical protein QO002_000142 [Pararhizobium capsulatum DSM 1112]|uniref:Uncharacterized protein n=1 Tax=Pararhizobium capsulatum DSM 1112 TaxID=1121113 RepID=A0ABU0BIG8_9HYPH|nr:hypothetical protein [Pararhizobium capsulatum]MDQ0318004.1 hypothetical protein [Pararhizobium capsulatum DSM 1112]
MSIDQRFGRELGLGGRYADEQAFQIVNDAHHRFLVLTSRLIDLEYGPHGDAVTANSLWPEIDKQNSDLAEALSTMGGNAVRAAALLEDMTRLNERVDALVAAIGGLSDEL